MKIQERAGAGGNRSAVPAQAGVGERLPTPPRERKPALAALAVLLILVGALGATVLVLRAGDRVEVFKATGRIEVGESATRGDLTTVMVAADDSTNYIQKSQLGALEKLKAKTTIYPGTVLVGEMFDRKDGLPTDKSSVGVALKEGQYPQDLSKGDTVAVYRVSDKSSSSSSSRRGGSAASDGALIVENARVSDVSGGDDATVSTGNATATLLVDRDVVAALGAASNAGELYVARVPRTAN